MTDLVTAAFFVPRSEATVAELAARAGVRDARGDEVLDGTWAGMRARVGRSRLELHDLVWIQLSQREWLAPRALDAPAQLALADDPNLPQAEAFRDACLALGAEVAVFVTHAAQADIDRIAGDCYRHVLGLDAEALARAFVGLLYLDDRVREGYAPPPDRDTLTTDRGLALFAGRGRARWHRPPPKPILCGITRSRAVARGVRRSTPACRRARSSECHARVRMRARDR